jgi:hypothetical protein
MHLHWRRTLQLNIFIEQTKIAHAKPSKLLNI